MATLRLVMPPLRYDLVSYFVLEGAHAISCNPLPNQLAVELLRLHSSYVLTSKRIRGCAKGNPSSVVGRTLTCEVSPKFGSSLDAAQI